jgi:hypothetical protein
VRDVTDSSWIRNEQMMDGSTTIKHVNTSGKIVNNRNSTKLHPGVGCLSSALALFCPRRGNSSGTWQLFARNYVWLTVTSYIVILTLSGQPTGVSAENGRVFFLGHPVVHTRIRQVIHL